MGKVQPGLAPPASDMAHIVMMAAVRGARTSARPLAKPLDVSDPSKALDGRQTHLADEQLGHRGAWGLGPGSPISAPAPGDPGLAVPVIHIVGFTKALVGKIRLCF